MSRRSESSATSGGTLAGRVAVVTGAGRGLGRAHARLLAAEGARVVVNDLGGDPAGSGTSPDPAAEVVAEIRATGGQAVPNSDDVSRWDGARRLIDTAVTTFGRLDVLVNNAGILRDRTLANMTEQEWDAVIAVHLKGHFAPTRWALAYWRDQSRRGADPRGSVINTSSIAGLTANYGQANYGAAKAGIATFTLIAAMEAARYGVRVNAIAPLAWTRLIRSTPGLEALTPGTPDGAGAFDATDPANVSPLVAYLAAAGCPVTGAVFHAAGREIGLLTGWRLAATTRSAGRWTVAELATAVPELCHGQLTLPSLPGGPDGLDEILTKAMT